MTARRHPCPTCGRRFTLRADGRIYGHGLDGTRCPGSGQPPAGTATTTTTEGA